MTQRPSPALTKTGEVGDLYVLVPMKLPYQCHKLLKYSFFLLQSLDGNESVHCRQGLLGERCPFSTCFYWEKGVPLVVLLGEMCPFSTTFYWEKCVLLVHVFIGRNVSFQYRFLLGEMCPFSTGLYWEKCVPLMQVFLCISNFVVLINLMPYKHVCTHMFSSIMYLSFCFT